MVGRRVALVATTVLMVAANATAGPGAGHRLPYLLAVMAVVALCQTFWERMGAWLLGSTGLLIVAMLVAITWSVANAGPRVTTKAEAVDTASAAAAVKASVSGEEPPSVTTTTLLSGTDVPAQVAGAVEERGDAERLATCESALAAIADAVRAAGGEVPATTTTVPGGAEVEVGRRLTSCEVRLQAIASTLPD